MNELSRKLGWTNMYCKEIDAENHFKKQRN